MVVAHAGSVVPPVVLRAEPAPVVVEYPVRGARQEQPMDEANVHSERVLVVVRGRNEVGAVDATKRWWATKVEIAAGGEELVGARERPRDVSKLLFCDDDRVDEPAGLEHIQDFGAAEPGT